MNDNHTIPFEKGAEAQVLGAMLYGPEPIAAVRNILTAEMFFDPVHQTIYEVFCLMSDNGDALDLASTSQEFRRRGLLDKIGQGTDELAGSDYLVDLMQSIPDSCNAGYYAEKVYAAATKRDLIRLANTLHDDACEPMAEVADLVSEHQQQFYAVIQAQRRITGRAKAGVGMDTAYDRNEAVRRGEATPGLSTGFPGIDRPIRGGLHNGELIILAADTARGKSSLALNMATHIAEAGGRVLFVSAEMEAPENGNRLLASLSGIDGNRLSAGGYNEQEHEEILATRHRLVRENLEFLSKSCTAGEIVSEAQAMITEGQGELAAIFVDYLQLMTPDNPKDNKAQQIGHLAWSFKRAAMDLSVPIIVLSQLSREHSRANRPPALHDLKESGDIENAANVVLFLWKHPDQGQDTDGSEIIYARIAKCRNGQTTLWPKPGEQVPGAISLRFKPHLTRFETRSL